MHLDIRYRLQWCLHRRQMTDDRGHRLWPQVQSTLKDTGRMPPSTDKERHLLKAHPWCEFPTQITNRMSTSLVSVATACEDEKTLKRIQYSMSVNINKYVRTYIYIQAHTYMHSYFTGASQGWEHQRRYRTWSWIIRTLQLSVFKIQLCYYASCTSLFVDIFIPFG